ncbi:MAG: ATP-grasp domain-containing protein [Desulfocucumaceae bacterium]
MNLFEFQAKQLFKQYGIPIPCGVAVLSGREAADEAGKLGGAAVIKAQVHAGGRGKAGLVRLVDNPAEAEQAAREIIGQTYRGELVSRVLVEEKLSVVQEFYLSVTMDWSKGLPVVLASSQGGVDIEELVKNENGIVMRSLDNLELSYYKAVEILSDAGLKNKALTGAARVLTRLVCLFREAEALTVEINPLVLTEDGVVIAADAKVTLDDEALERHPLGRELAREDAGDDFARRAREIGVSYVRLDEGGEIGIIAGGAGLAMATMDVVAQQGGRPVNFLDTGGGISRDRMAAALRLVLANNKVKGVVINVFGGINNCLTVAQGITDVVDSDRPAAEIVVKTCGHSQEVAWSLLAKYDMGLVKCGTTAEAVKMLMLRMQKETCCREGTKDGNSN